MKKTFIILVTTIFLAATLSSCATLNRNAPKIKGVSKAVIVAAVATCHALAPMVMKDLGGKSLQDYCNIADNLMPYVNIALQAKQEPEALGLKKE